MDHLATPRLVADENQKTVWRWDQAEPFGNNPANEDPDGDGVAFDLPLRLPGQYYDRESGLHYNYFRDYDPSIGRYAESDPVGLGGGLNTYVYVGNRPLVIFDLLGLQDSFSEALRQRGWDIPAPCRLLNGRPTYFPRLLQVRSALASSSVRRIFGMQSQ